MGQGKIVVLCFDILIVCSNTVFGASDGKILFRISLPAVSNYRNPELLQNGTTLFIGGPYTESKLIT
jgi:hypothetical protein